MEDKETVCAVVVTYNRKELLLECLESLRSQSYTLDAIYLIDNASTDKTPESLLNNGFINEIPQKINEIRETCIIIENSTSKNEIKLHYVRMNKNTGGAGGFYEGVKRAYEKGYDWLWLMDDDTIADINSLKTLINKSTDLNNIGFLCSKILWKNKIIHKMNIPQIKPMINGIPFNKFENKGVLIVKGASFVSLLLKKESVNKVGLPIKKFFIWGDDIEYTDRITDSGLKGFYVGESVVYHKTNENYYVNIFNDTHQNSWKHFYDIRNKLYIRKRRNYKLYLVYLLYHIFYLNILIIKHRKTHRKSYIWVNIKGSLSSIFFNPKIEKVQK